MALLSIQQDARGFNKLTYVPVTWQELYKEVRAIINTIVIIIIDSQVKFVGSKCLNCEVLLGIFRKDDWKEDS